MLSGLFIKHFKMICHFGKCSAVSGFNFELKHETFLMNYFCLEFESFYRIS